MSRRFNYRMYPERFGLPVVDNDGSSKLLEEETQEPEPERDPVLEEEPEVTQEADDEAE